MKNITLNTIGRVINNDNVYACTTPQMIENTGEKFANYINF